MMAMLLPLPLLLSPATIGSFAVAGAAAAAAAADDTAPIFHVGPAGCRGGTAPMHHGWTNGKCAVKGKEGQGGEVRRGKEGRRTETRRCPCRPARANCGAASDLFCSEHYVCFRGSRCRRNSEQIRMGPSSSTACTTSSTSRAGA
eukprot:SAG31_NODE_611_length_13558_cov_224.959730_6_plen_145_part_00